MIASYGDQDEQVFVFDVRTLADVEGVMAEAADPTSEMGNPAILLEHPNGSSLVLAWRDDVALLVWIDPLGHGFSSHGTVDARGFVFGSFGHWSEAADDALVPLSDGLDCVRSYLESGWPTSDRVLFVEDSCSAWWRIRTRPEGQHPPMTNEYEDERLDPDILEREGLSEATVEAVGKVSEALETIEVARGLLYQFHRMSGTADFLLGDAAELLRKAGHTELAEHLETEIIGRNVIPGRWTFQIVEAYDETYYGPVREAELRSRELTNGHHHLFEAGLKRERRSEGRLGHEAEPAEVE